MAAALLAAGRPGDAAGVPGGPVNPGLTDRIVKSMESRRERETAENMIRRMVQW